MYCYCIVKVSYRKSCRVFFYCSLAIWIKKTVKEEVTNDKHIVDINTVTCAQASLLRS